MKLVKETNTTVEFMEHQDQFGVGLEAWQYSDSVHLKINNEVCALAVTLTRSEANKLIKFLSKGKKK